MATFKVPTRAAENFGLLVLVASDKSKNTATMFGPMREHVVLDRTLAAYKVTRSR